MGRGPVFGGKESEVLVVGDSLVKYLGESRSYLEFVSLPGKGVDAVSLLVKEHLASRHKLVYIHVGTNDLAGGVPVHALYDKLCSLNASLPTGTQLCVSEVFRRWESNLPGCWYSLSPRELLQFNKNVDQLNHLLSRSSISVLGHHERFREERGLFARDGLHLSRGGSYFLAKEIADHAAQLMVCFQSCFVLTMMVAVVY